VKYAVTFDRKNQIVTLRISGKAAHADHCIARDKAVQLCHKKLCSRLMVDLRTLDTVRSTTKQCFAFGETLRHSCQTY